MAITAAGVAGWAYQLADRLTRPYTLLVLLTGLALAALWRRRRESRAWLLAVTLPFGALCLLSTPLVAHAALGSLEWQYPPRDARPGGAGAIVVLSGGVYPRDAVRPRDLLDESSLHRSLEAARVYRLGPPLPVVATGGKPDPSLPGPSCAALMAEFLETQGVRPSDLVVEPRARTTFENAAETRRLLADTRRIILVTEANHMPRSVLCFRRQGFEVIPWPCLPRANELHPSVIRLLPTPDAAADCLRAAHEWIGLAWYRLTGKV